MNPRVYSCVQKLCADPDTTVIIFSGADKAKLEETFGELDLWLAAENGMFMRAPPTAGNSSKVRFSSAKSGACKPCVHAADAVSTCG